MCCDCVTLKYCCKRTCDCNNPYFGIPMWIVSIIGIVAVCYFAVIGYGCLWSQFVWNNVFGHDTSCTPFNPGWFFGMYIFTGIGALLTTAIALALVAGVIVGIGFGIYGIYLLVKGCCNCCKRNYKLGEEDAQKDEAVKNARRVDDRAPLLKVNIVSQ